MTDPTRRRPLISLFCGPGGMDQGFKQAGYHTALAYDSEQHCVDTVNRNHGRVAVRGDLSVLTPEDIREAWDDRASGAPVGIIGGPPCQAFSFANVHKDDEDDRAKLVTRYAEIIDSLNRHYGISFFVFENVTGLLSQRHRHLLDHFIRRVEDADFSVQEQCLNAVNYRVPQHRERVFVVGINRRLHAGLDFSFPAGDPSGRTAGRRRRGGGHGGTRRRRGRARPSGGARSGSRGWGRSARGRVGSA